MSKFSEYLKAASRGIKNLDLIMEGLANMSGLKKLSPAQQDEIIRRAEICAQCPFNSVNAKTSPEYLDLVGKHYEGKREDLHCALCLCNLKAKVAALDANCGIEWTNGQTKYKKLPLKWKKYSPPPEV